MLFQTMSKWAREFNGIYTISQFGTPIVIISDCELLREMLVIRSQDFAGRPSQFRTFYINNMEYDLFTSGLTPEFVTMKKGVINGVKMYGDRLQVLEAITQEIVEDLVVDLEKLHGEPVDIELHLYRMVTDIMGLLVSTV